MDVYELRNSSALPAGVQTEDGHSSLNPPDSVKKKYGPFTGGSSPMGLSMRDGVRLAADEINARGGVLGKRRHFDAAARDRARGHVQHEHVVFSGRRRNGNRVRAEHADARVSERRAARYW